MSVRTTTAAAATATALLTLPLAPATAHEQDEGRLFLTLSGAQNTWIRGVRLSCPGPAGHHPHAADACKRLGQAAGRPDAPQHQPPPQPQPQPGAKPACTGVEDPVTATADGDWRGSQIAWRRTFPNPCALEAATGPVFRF
ncbi:SSI family serine proteinase inhibitor [Streptomyces sp. NPDC053048]|uniref:SSI family serine proteinase inhibitor n=1 Tax=Streptomyces sp. NPDC053048 TaxID=3365694 RepID=UPI0037CE42B5